MLPISNDFTIDNFNVCPLEVDETLKNWLLSHVMGMFDTCEVDVDFQFSLDGGLDLIIMLNINDYSGPVYKTSFNKMIIDHCKYVPEERKDVVNNLMLLADACK